MVDDDVDPVEPVLPDVVPVLPVAPVPLVVPAAPLDEEPLDDDEFSRRPVISTSCPTCSRSSLVLPLSRYDVPIDAAPPAELLLDEPAVPAVPELVVPGLVEPVPPLVLPVPGVGREPVDPVAPLADEPLLDERCALARMKLSPLLLRDAVLPLVPVAPLDEPSALWMQPVSVIDCALLLLWPAVPLVPLVVPVPVCPGVCAIRPVLAHSATIPASHVRFIAASCCVVVAAAKCKENATLKCDVSVWFALIGFRPHARGALA